MTTLPLQLPTIQNWSCHNCSGCCRQHLIEITEEERQRIEKQKWRKSDGIPDGQPVVEPHGGPPWNRRYRLANTEDGSCVFLNQDGLCRIHAKFGEAAKPLACRVYPYAFHPSGKKVTVSLRYSCPSVVANLGKAVAENRDELKQIARLVVPEGTDRIPPPPLHHRESVEWGDFLRIVDELESIIATDSVPLPTRLFRALYVVDLIGQSRFQLIQGEALREFLDILSQSAADEPVPDPQPVSRLGAIQFRQLVAHYARRDTVANLRGGLADRWRLLKAAIRFTRGTGLTPALQDCFREVPFSELEKPRGPLPDGTDEILTRYLRVKLKGLHFCGRAYYDVPLVEGFQSLALIIPAVCWIARWLAVSGDRPEWTTDDFRQALTIADHHHGYSPVFGSSGFRRRVRTLAQTGDLCHLILASAD